MVALCSAVKVVVVLGQGGGREGDQHQEGQGCACDAVRDWGHVVLLCRR
jgi:hypothetical protein